MKHSKSQVKQAWSWEIRIKQCLIQKHVRKQSREWKPSSFGRLMLKQAYHEFGAIKVSPAFKTDLGTDWIMNPMTFWTWKNCIYPKMLKLVQNYWTTAYNNNVFIFWVFKTRSSVRVLKAEYFKLLHSSLFVYPDLFIFDVFGKCVSQRIW